MIDNGRSELFKTPAEIRIIGASQAIRDKEGWKTKIKNPQMLNKWRTEALSQGLLEDEINFCLDQLLHFANLGSEGFDVGPFDGVWQADSLIPKPLQDEFRNQVSDLLEGQKPKDYHPLSNDCVVNLVHPALYCYVKGVTSVLLENIWSPETASNIDTDRNNYLWIPADFMIDDFGKVKIGSYINNLNPVKHLALYPLIEQIFELFLPLFCRVISDSKCLSSTIIEADEITRIIYGAENPRTWGSRPASPVSDRELLCRSNENDYQNWRILKLKIPKFCPPVRQMYSLNNKKVQVVVKLANIELTPENPVYTEGSWHIDGLKAESIIATGVYYYAMENITESKLAFCQLSKAPDHVTHADNPILEVLGVYENSSRLQPLGYLRSQEGRCVAFPNKFLHRILSFELKDKSKPGFRKALVFFLVDPDNTNIISSSVIPPQQANWDTADFNLFDQTRWGPRNTMTLEEAKKYRLKLIRSRENIIKSSVISSTFSFCEH